MKSSTNSIGFNRCPSCELADEDAVGPSTGDEEDGGGTDNVAVAAVG